jgi:hypothetical protein
MSSSPLAIATRAPVLMAIVAAELCAGPWAGASCPSWARPEAIRLFSDPNFARLTAHFAASPAQFRWLYDFQIGGFIEHEGIYSYPDPAFAQPGFSRTARFRCGACQDAHLEGV